MEVRQGGALVKPLIEAQVRTWDPLGCWAPEGDKGGREDPEAEMCHGWYLSAAPGQGKSAWSSRMLPQLGGA